MANLYWDANGATAGTGGTGNWDTTSSFWSIPGGSWSNTGSMSAARQYAYSSTLLSTGKVLVAGGNGLNTAQLYNPSTGLFEAAPVMSAIRYYHSAVALNDGRVLVLGGQNATTTLATAQNYNPGNNTWTTAASITTARSSHTANLLSDGRVLVAGGCDVNGASIATCYIYNPTTNTWAAAASLATARYSHVAVNLSDGRILIAGGFGATNPFKLKSAAIYTLASNTWAATPDMSIERNGAAGVRLSDGRVLVAGGASASSQSGNTAEIYDPTSNTWTTTGSMAVARSNHALILLPSGKVLVAGGMDASYVNLTSTEIWDPSTGTWTTAPNMSAARADVTLNLLSNGLVFVAGAGGSSSVLYSELFDPAGSIVGAWSNTGGNSAYFSGTAGTVTLAANVSMGGLFSDTTGFTINTTGSNIITMTAASTANITAGTFTINAPIAGAFNLTKTGVGNLTLSANNTYTGVTTVKAGILTATTLTTDGSASSLGASANTASKLVLDGGTFVYAGAAGTTQATATNIYREFTVTANSGTIGANATTNSYFSFKTSPTFDVANVARTVSFVSLNGYLFIDAVIADNGTAATSVTFPSSSYWTYLNGANTYSGNITLNGIAGALSQASYGNASSTATITINSGGQLSAPNALTFSLNRPVVLNGGTLGVASSNITYPSILLNADSTIGAGVSNGSVNGSINLNGYNLRTAEAGTAPSKFRVLGNITGAGGLIAGYFSSSGDTTLAGNNTYTGTTSINAGNLIISSIKTLGNTSSLGAPSTAALGVVKIGSTSYATGLNYTGSGDVTDRGIELQGSVNAAVRHVGTGLLKISGNVTSSYVGAKGFVLDVSSSGSGEISGNILGAGTSTPTNVYKTGNGTWTLSGNNTNTTVTVLAGTLAFSNLQVGNTASSLGSLSSGAANLVINGGTLSYVGSSTTQTTDRNFTLGASGGTLALASGTGWVNTWSGSPVYATANTAQTLNIDVSNANATSVMSGVVANNGTANISLNKTGSGTLKLTSNNTFSGNLTVGAGSLVIDGFGLGNIYSNVVNNGTLSLANITRATYFNTGVSGTGSLTKSGTGSVYLYGNSTFTGTVSVTGGNLTLGASATLSNVSGVSINGGSFYAYGNISKDLTLTSGTLLGNSTVNANVTVASSLSNTITADSGNLTISDLILLGQATVSVSESSKLLVSNLTSSLSNTSSRFINLNLTGNLTTGYKDLIGYSNSAVELSDFNLNSMPSIGSNQIVILQQGNSTIGVTVATY